jgi:hypothetical protein
VNPARERIGDWTTPHGNNVVVFYRPIKEGLGEVELEWDDPPPLSPADGADYQERILPAIVARLREFTEAVGPALVVSAAP